MLSLPTLSLNTVLATVFFFNSYMLATNKHDIHMSSNIIISCYYKFVLALYFIKQKHNNVQISQNRKDHNR